jgi:D-sedoheptulose 7-phosphate isomerase
MFPQYGTYLINALRAVNHEEVYRAYNIISRVRAQNASVFIIGNGGSASTAGHFANDLVKMAGVRAFSVPDMVPAVTAYGNDESWKQMYAAVLGVMLLPQDVVVAISCSGNSPNVVEAVKSVRNSALAGLKVIALLGADYECKVAKLEPNVSIFVPFKDIRVQEDCHLAICHCIAGDLANGKDEGSV